MKIIVTGATGLVGARFITLLGQKYQIIPLSTSLGVDITDPASVENFVIEKKPDVILHFAAKTDVDGCELDKSEDLKTLSNEKFDVATFEVESIINEEWKGKKTAFAINVAGTKNLAEAAREIGAKFIYVSTDFVFDGTTEATEEDVPHPLNWYGATKYLGEVIVQKVVYENIIARISSPYGFKSEGKKDFVWKFVDFLSTRSEVTCVDDKITPTFIEDIIEGIDMLIEKNKSGIWHIVGSSFNSPFEIASKIKETFNLSGKVVPIKAEDFFKDRAPRPYHSQVKNGKISELGFVPKTFDEGLAIISKQL